MTLERKIWLASKVANKGWEYETLFYGDDLYSEEDKIKVAEEIWEFVDEYEDIGSTAFYEKYKEFDLYLRNKVVIPAEISETQECLRSSLKHIFPQHQGEFDGEWISLKKTSQHNSRILFELYPFGYKQMGISVEFFKEQEDYWMIYIDGNFLKLPLEKELKAAVQQKINSQFILTIVE